MQIGRKIDVRISVEISMYMSKPKNIDSQIKHVPQKVLTVNYIHGKMNLLRVMEKESIWQMNKKCMNSGVKMSGILLLIT